MENIPSWHDRVSVYDKKEYDPTNPKRANVNPKIKYNPKKDKELAEALTHKQ